VILQFTARVEAAAFAREPFGVEVPPYIVDLGADENGRVTELRIQKRVDPHELELPKSSIRPDGVIALHTPTGDPSFVDLVDLAQYIESIGSFHLQIRRIYWQEGEYEWIPENEEERRLLGVFASKTSLKYPETPVEVRPEVLFRMVRSRRRLEHLKVPLAFFREGVNEYRAFRYVTAFHNLYFFLEDLYGGGKTKNRDVEQNFINSPQLVQATTHALQTLKNHEHHERRLGHFLQIENCGRTPMEILRFIVRMRGNLHHFSRQSTRPKGHPLNQHEFESVAFLLLTICYRVVALVAN
jgi:hypothetical protein